MSHSDSSFKRLAKPWDHRQSKRAARTVTSALKDAASTRSDSMITLGTGRPSAEFYPWVSLSTTEIDGIHVVAADMKTKIAAEEYPLDVALNYGFSAGSPHLLRFVTEHVEMIHDPPYADWVCALTCGSTSALDIVFQTLCDPGDTILVEKFTYTGTIQAARSQGIELVGIEMDEQGLMPSDLDGKLRNWDGTRGKQPGLLYMVPTGQNPTGTTQGRRRREEIYQVAEKHDLIIVEDDPYYFLQLQDGGGGSDAGKKGDWANVDHYIKDLPVSYLSLDVSGRAIRLDSFSKIMAPSLRCGWITASSQIVDKFLATTEVSTVAPSGVSQVMLYKLLGETWGHLGFLRWLVGLSTRYRQRRDVLIAACQEHLADVNCSWEYPTNGMFLWVEVRLKEETGESFRLTKEDWDLGQRRLEDEIFEEAKSYVLLISKGSWFVCPGTSLEQVHVRLTFAAAPHDALPEAVRRFSTALHGVVKGRES